MSEIYTKRDGNYDTHAEHINYAKTHPLDGSSGKWMVFHSGKDKKNWFLVIWTGNGPFCSQCGEPLHRFFLTRKV